MAVAGRRAEAQEVPHRSSPLRALWVAVGLFLVATVASNPPADAQPGGLAVAAAVPSECSAPEAIRIEDGLLLNPARRPEGPSELRVPATISAGTYSVTLVSSDDHSAGPAQLDQTDERWFIELVDAAGDLVYRVDPAQAISDLPDDLDSITEVVDPAATVTGTATMLRAMHLGAGTSINSIMATCVIFDPIPDPPGIVVRQLTVRGESPQRFSFDSTYGSFSLGDNEAEGRSLSSGRHRITQTVPRGWELTSLSCDDGNSITDLDAASATIDLEAGEVVTCTFTNSLIIVDEGWIVVRQVTDPPGSTERFGFTSGFGEFTLLGDRQHVSELLAPGSYSTTQVVPDDWVLTDLRCDDDDSITELEAATATITLGAGEVVTCTFTNEPIPFRGWIVVRETTVPAGSTHGFGFDAEYGAFALVDGQQNDAELAPASYRVAQVTPAGWELIDLTCDDIDSTIALAAGAATIDLDRGETVTCTFTNTDETSTPGDSSIVSRVWLDDDRDQAQQSDERGIPELSVELRSSSTDEVLHTDITDGDGAYSFDELAPGSYVVALAPGERGDREFTTPYPVTVELTRAERRVLRENIGLAADDGTCGCISRWVLISLGVVSAVALAGFALLGPWGPGREQGMEISLAEGLRESGDWTHKSGPGGG